MALMGKEGGSQEAALMIKIGSWNELNYSVLELCKTG
jgi:hypothetical protein